MAWAGVFDDFAGSSSFVGHGGSTNNTDSVSTSGRTSISDLVPGMPNGVSNCNNSRIFFLNHPRNLGHYICRTIFQNY